MANVIAMALLKSSLWTKNTVRKLPFTSLAWHSWLIPCHTWYPYETRFYVCFMAYPFSHLNLCRIFRSLPLPNWNFPHWCNYLLTFLAILYAGAFVRILKIVIFPNFLSVQNVSTCFDVTHKWAEKLLKNSFPWRHFCFIRLNRSTFNYS